MATNYIPTRESELVTWSANIQALLAAGPEAYGLTLAQEGAYTSAQTDFAQAYQLAQNPNTRTPSAIETKNTSKQALIALTRELVNIIQSFPGTTDTMRVDLGITVRDYEPTPVPPPSTAPLIDVLSVKTRRFELRLRDEVTSSKRKPAGVQGATLFSYVGEESPASLSDWKFEASTTKTDFVVDIPVTVPAGSKVWFTAFWFNRKSESGPATNPVYSWTNNGGVSMDEAA